MTVLELKSLHHTLLVMDKYFRLSGTGNSFLDDLAIKMGMLEDEIATQERNLADPDLLAIMDDIRHTA